MRFKDFFVSVLACIAIHDVGAKPNVVVILADDLGYGDVSPLNSNSRLETPSFDRLAKEGVTFTDAHSPSAVCTPTRYGLLCGRYCWRTRLKRRVLGGFSPHLIEPGRQTIGTLLQGVGYHTEVIGKWHLGVDWQWNKKPEDRALNSLKYFPANGEVDFSSRVENGANAVGFTRSYIIPGSLDMGPYVALRDGRVVELPGVPVPQGEFPAFIREGERSEGFSFVDAMDELSAMTVAMIKERAAEKKPFFLYLPFTAPHKPVLPHPRFRGKSGLGAYGDFVVQVDWCVGEVLDAIDAAGIAEETLVIVTSDNGSFMFRGEEGAPDHTVDETVQAYDAAHHMANGSFRGTKTDLYEGGHRVPFFVRWPGSLPAGKRDARAICLTDVLATVAEAVGVPFDREASPDSFSFLSKEAVARPPIVMHSSAGHFAVRDGDWKLLLSSGSGGREKPVGNGFEKPFQLYNLAKDPGERVNVIEANRERAVMLEAALEEIRSGGAKL